MTDESKSPLYSLVTFGRNDNYSPDFLYRLQTMLNFNARALEKIGRLGAVEFVVVDWGSAAPLREALALEAPAASATSFLELSPDIAARFSDAPRNMNFARAQNAGIRRANGRFVGIQGADQLMTSASWRALLSAFEDRHEDLPALSGSVLQIRRHIVPWSFVARQPDLDRWERWLLTCSQVAPDDPRYCPAVGGGMGIIILHRELWREANALEETFPGWGYTDNDLVLRVSAHHPWIDAGAYGVLSYKMEHDPDGFRGRLFKGRGNALAINPRWTTTSLASRFADWGLPQLALEPKKAGPRVNHGDAFPAGRARDRWAENRPESAQQCFDGDVSWHVSAALGRVPMCDEAELETLHMLSWFGLRRFPMNYLEIGLRHGLCVRAVATACPSVDIYVLESEEKNRDGGSPRAVKIATKLLWEWGHKGYFRVSAGDLLANLGRLGRSFIGPFDLEAVLLRLENHGHVELLSPALQAVVHGGLLAIHAARVDLLETALEACNSLAPDAHVMRGHTGRTAFLFVNRKEPRVAEHRMSPSVRSSLRRIPMHTRLRFRAAAQARRLRKMFRLL